MALRETQIVAPDFVGRIERVHVKPGDVIDAGTVIATLQSHDSADRIADLTAKLTSAQSRERQIEGRLASLQTLKPIARERSRRARTALEKVNDLARRQLTTSIRLSEATREVFDSEREETMIDAEHNALSGEIVGVRKSRAEMERLLGEVRRAFNDGRIVAGIGGTVGARVVLPGSVVSRGQAIAEIYHGETHVKAFMPNGRFYGIDVGDRVVVTDGVTRRMGVIARVEGVSDQLPQEFQSNFRSVERQQLMRIELDGQAPFAVPSKVRVLGRFTPNSVFALAKSVVTVAESPIEAARLMVAGLSGHITGTMDMDMMAVGSVARRRSHSAFELPPDEGPPDWRAITDRKPANLWRPLN
jgi:multidrug resistance efflux pump